MVLREIATEDVTVPELSDLYDRGIVDRIYDVFDAFKDTYYENFPVLRNCDEKMMPIYLTYTALCLSYIDDNTVKPEEYAVSLSNTRSIIQVVTRAVNEFAYLLMDIGIEESMYQENYELYRNGFIASLERDPAILEFKDQVYNEVSVRAVQNYLLAKGGINVEKLGVELTTEETLDLGVYIFYKCMYYYYVSKYSSYNVIGRCIYRRKLKNILPEKAIEAADTYLTLFDRDILTYEEFVVYLNQRKKYAMSILVTSQEQYDKCFGDTRKYE